ncbi:MAG: NCS2 family permease [Candidatus Stahlbacteria bacterium]|nr:NCS2 family permease [Candidatus Stahlbacteria bacterium]
MIERLFKLKEHKTNIRTEVIAGLTTFMTMAYIVAVNPAILEAAGIPRGPSMVATIIVAFFATFAVGIYANRPFAMATYMGENAFVAYTVVKVLGYSWQTALGAIFIGGIIFTIITILKLRSWFANAIPVGLSYSFAVGIGLFLTFIGLNDTGIVTIGVPGTPVHIGNVRSPEVLMAVFGILLIAILMVKKVRGAILIGMLGTTFLTFIFGIAKPPTQWVSLPPSIAPIFMKLDIVGALSWGFFAVILSMFVLDFVDTIGTMIGVSARAGFLNEKGELPNIEKPLLVDALSTVLAPLVGTTTSGTFIESAAGIEEGGRTGLTAVVCATLFLGCLFFAPIFTAIPPQAYGPALIIVGMIMISVVAKINFQDYTELIPAFFVIILMSFTYNIGIGITAGFVLYPIFKLISGRKKEIHPGLWVLFVLSLIFYIFYPY